MLDTLLIEAAATSAMADMARHRLDGKGIDPDAIEYIAKAIAAAIKQYDKEKNGDQE